LRGALGATAISALSTAGLSVLGGARPAQAAGMRASFAEISHSVDETPHVAPGYDADILIRWGGPVVPGAPSFDPARLTAEAQEKLFGYNNDFIGFVALATGSDNPDHGLLC